MKVGVITIRPFECILNGALSLFTSGTFLPSAERFDCPGIIPANIDDVMLWKIAGDKGAGSFKLILNTINVKCPQSLRHVQPICEFTAPDTRENLAAAMFHAGNPCKQDMEDLLHRRCVLFHVQCAGQVAIGLVRNTGKRHHRHRPEQLPKGYEIRRYDPGEDATTTWLERVTSVDFGSVAKTLLMYNNKVHKFDKVAFEDENKRNIGSFTLPNGIPWVPPLQPKPVLRHYLLAGLFTGDLEFLSLFLGHQGASAKWLCMLCMAQQTEIGLPYQVEERKIRFGRRKGSKSIGRCYEKFKKEFLDLDLLSRTKAKKEQVTRDLSYSIVDEPLADVPPDVITRATMHVILGLTKKY